MTEEPAEDRLSPIERIMKECRIKDLTISLTDDFTNVKESVKYYQD